VRKLFEDHSYIAVAIRMTIEGYAEILHCTYSICERHIRKTFLHYLKSIVKNITLQYFLSSIVNITNV